MAAAKIVPRLPIELLRQIIVTAWHMPFSSEERITLMRSSTLVNSTWADIFDLVSSRDVYIPSAAVCDHFIERFRHSAQPLPAVPSSYSFLGRFTGRIKQMSKPSTPSRSANLACRSITIQITNVDVHPDKNNRTRLPMGAVLDDLLENLDARSLAPNLRRLSIEYLDADFDDIFHRIGLAALPSQVTHLELRYSFSAAMPAWLLQSLHEKQEPQRHIEWVSRTITDLSVIGAGQSTINDMLRACANAQTCNGVSRECGAASTYTC